MVELVENKKWIFSVFLIRLFVVGLLQTFSNTVEQKAKWIFDKLKGVELKLYCELSIYLFLSHQTMLNLFFSINAMFL